MSAVLGALFAILLSTFGIAQYVGIQKQSSEHMQEAVTAQQQLRINEAASAYVQAYANQLQEIATATTPVVITVDRLKNAPDYFLPSSFNAQNPYNQQWQVQVLQPTPGNLQVLTFSTGGSVLKDKTVARIGALIGQAGGFIPQNDSGIYAQGNVYGAFGGWTLFSPRYQNMTGGRSASLLTFNNGQLASNYLYRNAVPEQPQLNQMNTSIDMQGNHINQAGQVNTTTLTTTGNTTVGGELAVEGNMTTSQNVSFNMAQIKTIVVPGTACAENGLLARDNGGVLISCQSGVWKGPQPKFKTAFIPIPHSGRVSLLAYIPAEYRDTVSAIQVSVNVRTDTLQDFGTDCYGYIDGQLFHRTGFDTSANKEWMATTGTILLSADTHDFSWSCNYGRIAQLNAMITGYL